MVLGHHGSLFPGPSCSKAHYISPNPELNFNLGFWLFFSKAFSHIIFSTLYTASYHCIAGKKNETKTTCSNLNWNLALTLVCRNPALNNRALIFLLTYKEEVDRTKSWTLQPNGKRSPKVNYCSFVMNSLSVTCTKYYGNHIRWFCYKIVMVSVKNHESQSRTNESQLKKKRVWNWKCLGLYETRQLIWRQSPKLCITVHWNYNIVLLF